MSTTHQRPGVFSDYDLSAVVTAAAGAKTVGVVARASTGTAGTAYTVASYADALAIFGDDGSSAGMMTLLYYLFLNGVAKVVAVPAAVGSSAPTSTEYTSALAALALIDGVSIVVCDSVDQTVQTAVKASMEAASADKRERIAVAALDSDTVANLTTRAAALNSERMVLVGPRAVDADGSTVLSGVCLAAAVAGVIACQTDPAVPLGGAAVRGFADVAKAYTETELDTLILGGVTPVECVAGTVSPVRGVTTRTTTGGAADASWRELTTVLIVDEVIPGLRNALRAMFRRTKNTARVRNAIRSKVIVELESRVAREIIDGYGEVTVAASETDPTVCVVTFPFTVAHGLNQIWLTAHITV